MDEQSTESSNIDSAAKQSSADKFFRDLNDRHLKFKLADNELEDIKLAVHEVVLQIVERIKDKDDRFSSHDVIRVGSFEEGTKIIEPNEFDYLIVIDELSRPDVVRSSRVCLKSRGYMHLQVIDEKTHERWADYIHKGEALGFVLCSPAYRQGKATSSSTGFSTIIMEVYKEHRISVIKPSGTLVFSGVTVFKEPNTAINLTWNRKHAENPIQISVDLSPAVRCYNTEEAITTTDCPYPLLYNELQQHGSYLLTPGQSHKTMPIKCFRISLTEVEVNLVKSLGVTHIICYRVLKYILGNLCCKLSYVDVCYDGFSSYILKSAVLHHSADGQCKSTHVHECMIAVVYSLLNCLLQDKPNLPNLPSIFVQDHNLFTDLTSYHSHEDRAMKLVMHAQTLMTFLFFIESIQNLPIEVYDYEDFINKLDTYILDIEKAYKNSKEIAKMFLDEGGSWKANGLSTKDLFHKFGVPYKLLDSKSEVE